MEVLEDKTRLCDSLSTPGSSLDLASGDERKKVKTGQLRNEASLNFVSLRSEVHYVARRGLSRVEMNALQAPLTALSARLRRSVVIFLLDKADAFIDGPVIFSHPEAGQMCLLRIVS